MKEILSRREFLKLCGAAALTTFLRFPGDERHSIYRQESSLPINERTEKILRNVVPLSFDAKGNLMLAKSRREAEKPVILMPTRKSKEYEKIDNKVRDVKLLVVHNDGGPRLVGSERVRNAKSTVRALDGNGFSVHWCVDEFKVNSEGNDDIGYGILQTQPVSKNKNRPLKGRHVGIGVELATGRPDLNRVYTAEYFKKLGLESNLRNLVRSGIKDINSYSVGFEQIGWYYSRSFPDNFPPDCQIANAVSLSITAMREYGLGIWDIVGHNEIQEKADPGHEFMATLRYLVLLNELKKYEKTRMFLYKARQFKTLFNNVYDYFARRVSKNRLDNWDRYMGFSDFISNFDCVEPKWFRRGLIR